MKCQSCGRTSKEKYCSQCADDRGNLKSFEDIAQNLTEYFVETQGFDREVAKSAAIGVMSRQPAWEAKIERDEKGKDMRMKTFLIVTAVVFTVVGAGIAYWFGTKTKADDSIKFANFSKLPQAPFENIEKSKVDIFEVFEMKCPADQKLVELDGDYLTIKSLEGSEFSPDYQLYTYNTASKTGYKFIPESLATRTQLMDKGSGLVFQKTNGNTNMNKINWYYCPKTGLLDSLNYSFPKQYGKTILNVSDSKIKAIDTLTGNVRMEASSADICYSAVSDNFVVYNDSKENRIVVKWFDGKIASIINKGMVWSVSANNFYVLISYIIQKKEITFCFEASTSKEIWRKEILAPVFLSQGNNPEQTIIYWSSERPSPNSINKNLSSISYICMNDPGKVNHIPPLKGFEDKDMYIAGVSSNLILWDFYRHNYRTCTDNAWKADTVSLWNVFAYDIATGTSIQLDTKNCDSVLVDGWRVAWEKYEGKENEQFYNVKFANLKVDDTSKRNVMNSGEIKSFEKIQKVGKFEVVELEMAGDQKTTIDPGFNYIKIIGTNDSLIPFVSGKESMLYNINNKQKIMLKYGDKTLSNFLGDCSVEWTEENPEIKDGTKNWAGHYNFCYNSTTKQCLKDSMTDKPVKSQKDIITVEGINGVKKDIKIPGLKLSLAKAIKTNNNQFNVIDAYDNLNEKLSVYIYDHKNDKLVKICEKSIQLYNTRVSQHGRFLCLWSADNNMIVIDLDNMKQITKKRDSSNELVYYLDPIENCFEKTFSDDPYVIANVDNKRYLMKMWDYFNGEEKFDQLIDIGEDESIEHFAGDYIIASKNKNSGSLYVKNIKTREIVVLADKGYKSYSSRIYGNYLAWTIDRGRKDGQYTNVCYARIK